MPKGLVPFLTAVDIQKIVQRLADELNRDYADQKLVLVCPLRGSVFFLADLVRQLSKTLQVDFVCIENDKNTHFRIRKDISLDLKNRHVVIVDKIIDSGLSMAFLQKRIHICEPASCKVLVLFDKPSHRKTFVCIDYLGQVVDDRFIVGYGMDMDEQGRGLADIYHLGQ